VAAVCLGLALQACGQEEADDLVNGKTLFVQKCGSCHTLARAGTQGVQGPDLDMAFASAREDGFNRETVKGVVKRQIANVLRGSTMPEDLVEGQDANDVAAYVAAAAGERGEDQGALANAGKPKVSKKPVVAENGKLDIDADPTGALAFISSRAEGAAGAIELVMNNEASVPHNIAVKGDGVDEKGAVVEQGGTSTVSANLKPGEYVFYCSVPGHEAGGMKGTLTVK
jgi:mono/diheme cytochrome c family protein